MEANEGYDRARKLLETEFGNPYVMARAYTKQAEDWPELKSEDKTALKDFALFLTKCENAMKGESHLRELNHYKNLQMLVYKLPFKLRDRWRSKTYSITQVRPVQFKDLVEFVNREAKIMSQEVFGNLATIPSKDKGAKSSKKATSGTQKRNTYAVSTETVSPCLCCADSTHEIQDCQVFADKSYDDKKQLIKMKGLCFGCLKNGKHLVKDCTNKLTCGKCGKTHPTVLHFNNSKNQSENKVVTTVGMIDASHQTAENKQRAYRPVIIPVKVKCRSSGISVVTYAFIDNGSDTVFCTETFRRQLNVGGKKQNLH
ncbi:uncharacterized protein [Ptychodera flava]|uniref:uncharacterized protein n=1 Tax=Ptychodera flava TaxID=63121 RepID=UPI00396A0B33